MRRIFGRFMLAAAGAFFLVTAPATPRAQTTTQTLNTEAMLGLKKYKTVPLTTDLTVLSEKERQMIPLLIEAARAMDEIFWQEVSSIGDSVLSASSDHSTRRYIEINYGPWDRLDGNKPFVDNVGPKPAGANFYPRDMTKEEMEKAVAAGGARADALKSLYTLVRRDASGALEPVPYHVAFREPVTRAAALLREAAALAEDAGLKRYLELRAEALLTDEYRESDRAWLDMKTNGIDVVIGPIETYEDEMFGYKASHEAFVLVKDREWSQRLERYAALLPDLQRGLPVDAAYKKESPGTDSDLNAYDAIYYAGDANAGAKTIAINLPNDETVQLEKGTRRLQLKNAMRAKFDAIMLPIAEQLIDPSQSAHVTFDAFFGNTMFHEVAHGLGIKNTINGRGLVREALKERAGAIEEGKADILGLYMVDRLTARGEMEGAANVMDNYVTFMTGIFRSIRFGASSAHARANVACFNFFEENGAFQRDAASGRYRVDPEKMRAAIDALSAKILVMQGDGDYDAVTRYLTEMGAIDATLEGDLARLAGAGIPVDIVFEQGTAVLGLAP
ncbi:MAG: dipeptidyl-peptidase 3 family protein [bacterium]